MHSKLLCGVVVGILAAQLFAPFSSAQEKPKPGEPKLTPVRPPAGASKAGELKTLEQKVGYALGLGHGRGVKQSLDVQSIELEPEAILRGFRDGLGPNEPALTDEEIDTAFRTMLEQVGQRNLKEGQAFLAANKKKPGVTSLPSGLQVKVLKKGSGKKPGVKDFVVVNYRGKLLSGKVFDSSYERKVPSTFGVTGVIPGWVEALQLMEVGSKWELYVPADLAYGAEGNEMIGPNSVLVFEIELLDIAKPGEGPGAGRPDPRKGTKPPEELEN